MKRKTECGGGEEERMIIMSDNCVLIIKALRAVTMAVVLALA